MVPYFEHPSLRLGPITIHAFGLTPAQYVSLAAILLLVMSLIRHRATAATPSHSTTPA